MNNTYLALTHKKLNVAYFGGSVTDGHGATARANSWRALTTRWLQDTYDAQVTEVNGAIGGTGTKYGVYRAVEHLQLRTVTPDLVFVEFAVNDYYDGLTAQQAGFNMEHILNTIYDYAPKADIVMVLTGNYATMSGNNDFVTRTAHKAVAKAYRIPTIDVATPLWHRMCEENGGTAPSQGSDVWKKYVTDEVHPADAGYAEYAATVQAFLKDTLDAGRCIPTEAVDAYRPADTLQDIRTLLSPRVDTFAGCTFEDADITLKTSGGSITDPVGGLITSKANTTFAFDFQGTGLSLWLSGTGAQPSSGSLEITIDTVKIKDVAFTNITNHTLIPIKSGLTQGTHTVTVKLKADANGTANLDLRYVLTDGNAQRSGIFNVK